MANASIAIFGAGAIGSNLAFNLAKQGFMHIKVWDDDRVEDHNIGTQIYGPENVGQKKVKALESIVYLGSGVELAQTKDIRFRGQMEHFKETVLVDAFDNSESRQLLYDIAKKHGHAMVHCGFNGAFAEIKWNEKYIVPSNVGQDICEYPLARNFVTLTTSVLAEIIVRYLTEGKKDNAEITFRDLRIDLF